MSPIFKVKNFYVALDKIVMISTFSNGFNLYILGLEESVRIGGDTGLEEYRELHANLLAAWEKHLSPVEIDEVAK